MLTGKIPYKLDSSFESKCKNDRFFIITNQLDTRQVSELGYDSSFKCKVSIEPSIGQAHSRIIGKCMQKDRNERYQHWDELVREFERIN
jgi:serine/threonine protein kinase